MDEERPSWWTFFAWPLVGAALAVSVLGAMTIGLFVLPFATVGLLALLKWGGNRKSAVGIVSGLGLPFFYIAYLNRGGPGMICGATSNGGQECTQEYSPWPFLLIGALLLAAGVLLFRKRRNEIK